jgi:hypothetical protein
LSNFSLFQTARKRYYAALLKSGVLSMARRKKGKEGFPNEFPSNADGDSTTSIRIAQAIFDRIQSKANLGGRLADQFSGSTFEQITRSFVEETFNLLKGLPEKCDPKPDKGAIFRFEPYRHFAGLSQVAGKNPGIAKLSGSDYVIAPDFVVVREPVSNEVIKARQLIADAPVALRSGIGKRNNMPPLPNAAISCKWTLFSCLGQNARSEALNLMSNWRGQVAHIAVVTGEPLPSRIATLALGTSGIDCIYHFALPEFIAGVKKLGLEDSVYMLKMMVDGKQLKDISALPLDLAVCLTE